MIRTVAANSDYRLHNMETGSFVNRSRNRSQEYGTEDDGFSIELRTFNFTEYSARFATLKIYFRQKWNTNFMLSVYSSIQAMRRRYRFLPWKQFLYRLDTTRRAEFVLFSARITSFSHLIELAVSIQKQLIVLTAFARLSNELASWIEYPDRMLVHVFICVFLRRFQRF